MELNLRTVVELVEKVIQERGENYVYVEEENYLQTGGCVNVLYDIINPEVDYGYPSSKDNKTNFRPGCIVGSAALATGLVDLDWFFHMDRNGASYDSILSELEYDFGVPATALATDFLMACQVRQDSSEGYTWKEAYDYAWKRVLWGAATGRTSTWGGNPNREDLEYIQECFGKFRTEEENAAVSS